MGNFDAIANAGIAAVKSSPSFLRRFGVVEVALWWASSRLCLEVIGWLGVAFFAPHLTGVPVSHMAEHRWLSMWGVWDTGWYLDVAINGYDFVPKQGVVAGQANWAFFPAYPMLCAAVAGLLGAPVFVVMLAMSNLCFLLALLLVWREAEDAFGAHAARATVVLLCVTPGSYIFSSAYTESMFLMASMACLVLLRRQRWRAAGMAAALAALTRNTGILLLLPMFYYAVCEAHRARWRLSWHLARRAGVAMAMPVLALAGFCLFLWWRTGDPLAFASIQRSWGRSPRSPLGTLAGPLGDPGFVLHDAVNWAFALVAVALLVVLACWRQWMWLAYGVVLVVLPLSVGLQSFARFSIVMPPLLLAAGALLGRFPGVAALLLPMLGMICGFMMLGWVSGLEFVW
jgi:hypothetical protein